MKKIVYIEAKDDHQPEYNFLNVYAKYIGITDIKFVPIDGKDNLLRQEVQFKQNELEGDRVAVLFDADETSNNGGFTQRLPVIASQLKHMNVEAPIFLWPNHHDDGDFEMMLEHIVRDDLHTLFFDCFRDYENCVADKYETPNRKGKFHTFVTAQKGLSKRQRNKIGHGNWLFLDATMWNLDSPYLEPLKKFLESI